MAGLYIHIPFCASRCIYCDFYSTTRLDLRQQYVDALCREMELRSVISGSDTEPPTISTIYLGGGTPSQLTPNQLQQIFIYINNVYCIVADSEVTIEMNPDDVTPKNVATLQQLGINRISMGAQTFDERRLNFLRRRHTATQVRQAVSILRSAGIRNISIDLMYGFPDETIDDLLHDINAVLTLDVEHISAYCLMVEEGTPLHRMGISPCDEETERQMYYLLIDHLTTAGYEHYEISNWAKSGYRSCHNSNYWTGVPYIGLGAAAHSFDGQSRSWNAADIKQYITAISMGHRPCQTEILTPTDRYNERVMLGLRTSDGLDISTLTPRDRHYCMKEAQPFLTDGMLRLTGNRLVITRKGLFVSDMVMAALVNA